MRLAVRRALSVAVAATVAVVLAAAGCASSGVNIEPDAQAGTAEVRAVVQLPVDLGYGGPADVPRVPRRTGGAMIALAGGHVVLADELGGQEGIDLTDKQIADAVRAAGEDPEHALTFAIVASRA